MNEFGGDVSIPLKKEGQRTLIFDAIRKKYVVLTPEEWVRQHLILWLINERKVPSALIAVERGIVVYGRKKRFDALVFNRSGQPVLLIECKAQGVVLGDEVFQQAGNYLKAVPSARVLISNGTEFLYFERDEAGHAKRTSFSDDPFWE